MRIFVSYFVYYVRNMICIGLMSKSREQLFYAVGVGRKIGVYNSWNECKCQVEGVPNPKFRKFHSLAEAEEFVKYWKEKSSSKVKSANDGRIASSSFTSKVREYHEASNSECTTADAQGCSKKCEKNKDMDIELVQERISNCEKKLDLCLIQLQTVFSGLNQVKNEFGELSRICESYSESKKKINSDSGCANETSKDALELKMTETLENIYKVKVEDLGFSDSEDWGTPSKRKMEISDEDSNGEGSKMKGSKKKKTAVQIPIPFTMDEDNYVVVYTDGCCLSNGYSNAKAGIGIWFGEDHPLNVSQPMEGAVPTNNKAEIQAATKAMEIALEANIPKLKICTDSEYLINSATNWMPKWKRNNWIGTKNKTVENKSELQKMDKVMSRLSVRWEKVPAHSGVPGNEAADRLANEGASWY